MSPFTHTQGDEPVDDRPDVTAFLERAREQRAREILYSIGLRIFNIASDPYCELSLLPNLPLTTLGQAFGEWAWVGRVYV